VKMVYKVGKVNQVERARKVI